MARNKSYVQKKIKTIEKVPNKTTHRFNIENIKNLDWILTVLYFIIMTLVSFTFHKIADYGIESDFVGAYIPQAMKLSDGIFIIDKYKGPFYPMVLYVINLFFNNFLNAGIFIAILSASFGVYFFYSLFRILFSPLVAFITTILMAVNTTFILYTYSAGTDMFFFLIAAGALFFLLRNKEFKWINVFLAGLFAGLAYITRYNGIFLLVGSVSVILFINLFRMSWVKRFIATAIFVGTFILIITPWGFYTHKEKGKAFWNQNYQNVAYEYLAKGEMGWDEFWYQGNRDKYSSLSQVILQEPGKFFKKFVNNSFDHLGKDLGSLIGWHVAIFSIIGLLLLFTKPPTRHQWSYYLTCLLFFGVLLLVFYSERFSLFLIPFYTVFGVNALFSENKYVKDKIIKSPVLIVLISGILLIWTFSNSYKYNSENINSGDKNLLKLKEQFDQVEPINMRGDKILARKAHIAYYLGLEMPWVKLSNNYYEQMALIWRNGIDYVSYGIWEMGRGLNFLQDPDKLPPNFEIIAYSAQKNKVISKIEDNSQTYKINVKKRQEQALLFKIKTDSAEQQIIRTGNWINDHYSIKDHPEVKQEKIMASLPIIGFYTNRIYEEMPSLNTDNLVAELRQRGITYLYFGRHEASTHLNLAYLLDPDSAPEGLTPIFDLSKNSLYPAVLYRLDR
ncbi:MAG: glycosyltransferase family 39 protein [Bacteroidetes bacterium]|nr:glycosyltransferase family 39 protein [Bacteroidota bacterium]